MIHSLRVWKNVLLEEKEVANNKPEVIVFYGHTCRIWDCVFFENFLISSGEDRTCRVWNYETSNLVTTQPKNGTLVSFQFIDDLSRVLFHTPNDYATENCSCCHYQIIFNLQKSHRI